MPKVSTLASLAATLAAAACIARPVAPTPATLALYDANNYNAAAVPATRNVATGSSSGVTPIGDFVRSRNSQLQFCYEETRRSNPELAGSATIGVLLSVDGTVTRADVLRRTWDGQGVPQVEGCVLAKVRSWKFPAAADGAATRPYSFSVVFTRRAR